MKLAPSADKQPEPSIAERLEAMGDKLAQPGREHNLNRNLGVIDTLGHNAGLPETVIEQSKAMLLAGTVLGKGAITIG